MSAGRGAGVPVVVPVVVGVLATGAGGALGAVARWSLTESFPTHAGHFPWTVLLVNVVGSGLLALLSLLPVVARRAWLALFLGTGVLGGFTTMSVASTDTFVLLDRGETVLALAYCLGTLAAALAAVLLVERVAGPARQQDRAAGAGAG
jgi:fluoride exporter